MSSIQEPTISGGTKDGLEFIAFTPTAFVDHVAKLHSNDELKALLPGETELHGSKRVTQEALTALLSSVDFLTRAGGATTNVCRGVAHLGLRSALVGQRGQDEWGSIFHGSMRRANVNMDRVRVAAAQTGRCVVLVGPGGERTMRTYQDDSGRLGAAELTVEDFSGQWVLISLFALYGKGLVERALQLARQAGARVVIHMGTFEVVRAFRSEILGLFREHGPVDLLIGNEDEAFELLGPAADAARIAEQGLELMMEFSKVAVVTMGERGCVFASQDSRVPRHQPAYTAGVAVVDTTGAGDLFTAGFLYALAKGYQLDRCAYMGTLAAAAVCQCVGAEVGPAEWAWFHGVLHGERAGRVVRESVETVRHELQGCYDLINKLGRGVVYYGSARLKPGSEHWRLSVELSRRLAVILGVTTWTGGGPGIMEAASRGAMEVGAPVGAIKIGKEAGTRVLAASYLPADTEFTCKYLAPRKVGLTDAGIRRDLAERTAYIFLPGGLGTMDELMELLTLAQLRKLGTAHPVPIVIANYAGLYDGFVQLLRACERHGTIAADELHMVVVCDTNDEIIDYLCEFYGVPQSDPDRAAGPPRKKAKVVSEWIRDTADDGTQTADVGV